MIRAPKNDISETSTNKSEPIEVVVEVDNTVIHKPVEIKRTNGNLTEMDILGLFKTITLKLINENNLPLDLECLPQSSIKVIAKIVAVNGMKSKGVLKELKKFFNGQDMDVLTWIAECNAELISAESSYIIIERADKKIHLVDTANIDLTDDDRKSLGVSDRLIAQNMIKKEVGIFVSDFLLEEDELSEDYRIKIDLKEMDASFLWISPTIVLGYKIEDTDIVVVDTLTEDARANLKCLAINKQTLNQNILNLVKIIQYCKTTPRNVLLSTTSSGQVGFIEQYRKSKSNLNILAVKTEGKNATRTFFSLIQDEMHTYIFVHSLTNKPFEAETLKEITDLDPKRLNKIQS